MSKSFDDYISEMMQMYRETAKNHIEYQEDEVIPAEAMSEAPADIEEAFPAEKAAVPPATEDAAPKIGSELPMIMEDMSGSGRLVVKVTTARGMLPVEGAKVTVSQTEQNGGDDIITLKTDKSGITPETVLSAPPKYKSEAPLSPSDNEEVMAKYDITVSAEGYADAVIKGAAVFDKVTSIQNVDMLTASAEDDGSAENK